MVECWKRTSLYQAQEWGERTREGLLADSDIEDINRNRPGWFAGKRVSLVDLWSEFLFGGGGVISYLAKKARISS